RARGALRADGMRARLRPERSRHDSVRPGGTVDVVLRPVPYLGRGPGPRAANRPDAARAGPTPPAADAVSAAAADPPCSRADAASLVLTRRLQKGYVSVLAESLRAGTVHLDPVDVVDQTTRATLALADAQKRRVAVKPVTEPQPADAGAESWLDAASVLRSGDPDRIRGVLTRDAALEPV